MPSVRLLIGVLVLAFGAGLIVAIALTPPVQLYNSAALYQAGNPPANIVPSPDWGAGVLAAGSVLLVLAGTWVALTRRRVS